MGAYLESVHIVLAAGLPVNKPDRYGRTALYYALLHDVYYVKNDHYLSNLLMDHGALLACVKVYTGPMNKRYNLEEIPRWAVDWAGREQLCKRAVVIVLGLQNDLLYKGYSTFDS